MTEDYTVKTTVIFELSEDDEAKASRVHLTDRGQIIRWPRYTHR